MLSKPQDGDESVVDAPLLFWSDVTDEVTKPTSVDGSHLLNEHPSGRPELGLAIGAGDENRARTAGVNGPVNGPVGDRCRVRYKMWISSSQQG